MNILNFLKNIETDFNGRFIEDIWNYSSNEIEYNHDFIQLLFPLDKPSESVFHGVYLKSKNEINKIKNDDLAKLNIIKSSKWFLIFLKNTSLWKNKYDHNHLRISRVIQSLRLLVSEAEADNFYNKVLLLVGQKNKINSTTKKFWEKS